MKKLLTIVLFLFLTGIVYSQQMSVGAGGSVVLPMGNLSNASSLGLGGTVQFEYQMNPVVLTAESGYLNFLEKSGNGFSAGIIPIIAGAKYPFGGGLYAQAQTGLHMISQSAKIPEIRIGGTLIRPAQTITSSSTEFGFHAGAGYEMGDLDFVAKFSSYASGWSSVNLNVRYKFGL
ncbi:MAG: hypothetical protein ACPL25_03445 [Ignavibacteria bacterium]